MNNTSRTKNKAMEEDETANTRIIKLLEAVLVALGRQEDLLEQTGGPGNDEERFT